MTDFTAAAAMATAEWIIFGWRQGKGYMVAASKTLTEVELRVIAGRSTVFGGRYVSTGYQLTARLDSFVMAWGATYQEAIATLMKTWDPEPEQQRGLPAATPCREDDDPLWEATVHGELDPPEDD